MLVVKEEVPGPFAMWSTDAKEELQPILSKRAAGMDRDLGSSANRWSLWEWVGPWDGTFDPAWVRDTTRNLYFVNSAQSQDDLIARLAQRQSWVFQRCERVVILEIGDQAEFILRPFMHNPGSLPD